MVIRYGIPHFVVGVASQRENNVASFLIAVLCAATELTTATFDQNTVRFLRELETVGDVEADGQ